MHEEQTTTRPNSTIVVLGSINLTAASGNDTNANRILLTATPCSSSSSTVMAATPSSAATSATIHQSSSRASVHHQPTQYFFSSSVARAIATNTFRDNTPILIDGSHCGAQSVIMNINDDDLYVDCTPVTRSTASDVCILPIQNATTTTTILVQTSTGLVTTATTTPTSSCTTPSINNNNNSQTTNNNNTSAVDQSFSPTNDSIEFSLKEATFTIDDDDNNNDDDDDDNASQGEQNSNFQSQFTFPDSRENDNLLLHLFGFA